ncbi:MAG TPA: hypothetical protein VHV83_15300, partial [Armatimonadota bacterium]|nr:hypothetical protein [Armatimonadota bacterium]
VKLAPGEEKAVNVTVDVPQWRDTSDFPHTWRAFLYCDPNLNITNFADIPETVTGQDGKNIGWTSAYLIDNRIDLRRLAARADDVAGTVNFPQKSPAVLFAEFNSDTDKTITVGAAADWWMEWSVNGKIVYTTIPQGNGGGGYNIHTHNFKVPLKRGRNLFAVKVLSGSQGWQLCAGGPSDLAQGSLENVDRLEFSLVGAKKRVIGMNTSLLNYRRPLEPLTGDFWSMKSREWGGLAPTAKLGEAQVTNLFFKHPDSSRWWKGERDFSAFLWLRQDSKYLYTVVEVTDDSDKLAQQETDLANSDHLRVAVAGADGKIREWAVGRVAGKSVINLLRGTAVPDQPVRAEVERNTNRTLYRIAIPRTAVNSDSIHMNLIITDNDNGYRKQYISWMPFQADEPEPAPDRWQPIELR